MSQMKLKSFNYFIGLLIISLYSPLFSDEKIDIWKNKIEKATDSQKQEVENNQGKPDLLSSQTDRHSHACIRYRSRMRGQKAKYRRCIHPPADGRQTRL